MLLQPEAEAALRLLSYTEEKKIHCLLATADHCHFAWRKGLPKPGRYRAAVAKKIPQEAVDSPLFSIPSFIPVALIHLALVRLLHLPTAHVSSEKIMDFVRLVNFSVNATAVPR